MKMRRRFILAALTLLVMGAAQCPDFPWPNAQQILFDPVTQNGAICDGITDASVGINSAMQNIRNLSKVGGSSDVGRAAKLAIYGRVCLLTHSVNLTGIYGTGFVADFKGTIFICQTSGTPCFDATGDGQITISGLSIYAPSTNSPNIGLAIGRITNNGVGADHNLLERPSIIGYYTVAPFFNNQSETTKIESAQFTNQANNAYGAVWDGYNHFNFQSAFTGQNYPADTYLSFNENTCDECIIKVFGSGSVPIWMGATARHRFSNSYVYSASIGPEIILSFGATGGGNMNDMLDLDIHFEGTATNLVQFQGVGALNQSGLRMRDFFPSQNGPLFSRGAGVTTVNISDAHFEFGRLSGTSPSWWDVAADFTVSGYIYNKDNSYTSPNAFTGMLCGPNTCAVH